MNSGPFWSNACVTHWSVAIGPHLRTTTCGKEDGKVRRVEHRPINFWLFSVGRRISKQIYSAPGVTLGLLRILSATIVAMTLCPLNFRIGVAVLGSKPIRG